MLSLSNIYVWYLQASYKSIILSSNFWTPYVRISEKIYYKLLNNKKIEDVSELYKWLSVLGVDSKDEVLTHDYFKKEVVDNGMVAKS